MIQYSILIFASFCFYTFPMKFEKQFDHPASQRCKVQKTQRLLLFNQALRDLRSINRKPLIPSNKQLQRKFYMGIYCFNQQKFNQSVHYFATCKEFFLIDEHDTYLGTYHCSFAYLAHALTLLQLDKQSEAITLLQKAENFRKKRKSHKLWYFFE